MDQNKQKIIFLQGLPASGKSTWAKQYCEQNPDFVSISKDDIRILMGNLPWSREFENTVVKVQEEIIQSLLLLGKSVIIDDTNFSKIHLNKWEDYCQIHDLEFEIKAFDTSVDECIRRDSEREKSVGKHVILGMWEKYIKLE